MKSEKKHKFNRLFILLGIFFVVFILGIFLMPRGDLSKPRNDRRKGDILEISSAMQAYKEDIDKYPQSENLPINIEPYLDALPEDPGNGPCSSYQWISNMSDPQKYCVWACLENDKFFAASHKGIGRELDKVPTNLDCWTYK